MAECSCEIHGLPTDVLEIILAYLGARDCWAASQACIRWRSISRPVKENLKILRVSEFYEDLIKEEGMIERPAFHRREELRGLILLRGNFDRRLLRWLHTFYPNIINLSLRNCIPRDYDQSGRRRPSSRYHVFITDDLLFLIHQLWPKLVIMDFSGEIVDIRAFYYLKLWRNLKEIRLSGADLSFNMLTKTYLVKKTLKRTIGRYPLQTLNLSNIECKFDFKFDTITTFQAINNNSLNTSWLTDFIDQATNLKSLMLDCQYLHDANIIQISKLEHIRTLVLRNCLHVNDFSPLGHLPSLRSIVIDFGGKGNQNQLCRIIQRSKNWRSIIFNEVPASVGHQFMVTLADHCRHNACPLIEFQMNTENTPSPFLDCDWTLPDIHSDSIKTFFRACPRLEIFGMRTGAIEDGCLFELARTCPRMARLVLQDSPVTNQGVLTFYETLRSRRAQLYSVKTGGLCIDLRCTQCSRDLPSQAIELFGDELKVTVVKDVPKWKFEYNQGKF